MRTYLSIILAVSAVAMSAQAMAQITLYERDGFRGRAFTSGREVANFERAGFNDRASSVIVQRGRWEVCDDARFHGHCVVLREGSYGSLRSMGLNDRLSSARPVGNRDRYENEAPVPQPVADYEWRRRPNERVSEVAITSSRAVYGEAGRRCWVERERVDEPRGRASVGGGIAGAIIGGVIGHQIGSGRGNTIATVGGAAAGAAIGANVGRDGGGGSERDVQHCATSESGPPQYWDVTYNYRRVEHHVQMEEQPGRTIIVNRNGEPRQ
ncbi:MAG: beta/gamma crystallin family protein [Gammaproteobacteria bacterium]